MADFLNYGIIFTMLMVTLNGFLLIGGIMASNTATNSSLFAFLPSSFGVPVDSAYSYSSIDSNKYMSSEMRSVYAPTDTSIFSAIATSISVAIGIIPMVAGVINALLNLGFNLMFGMVILLATLGFPPLVVWGFGLITFMIELLTIIGILAYFMASLTGGGG